MSIVRVLSLVIIAFQATDGFFHPYDRCEKIYIPLCVRVLPYNLTRFPNLLGDRSQVFVNRSMLHYGSLVEHANCSKNAVFLFCSFFLPMCMPGIDDHDDSEENRIIKPCRSLCEQVRADCRNTIGADQWPPWAKCEELPQYSENVCISPESFVPASNSSRNLDNDACQETPPANYSQFDYVIKVKVVLIKEFENEETIIGGRVRRVFKQNNVIIRKIPHRTTIWSNASSTCPSLESKKVYFIGGHEDASTGRLLLSSTSSIEASSNETLRRIRKWFNLEKKKGGRSFRVPKT